MVKQYPNYKASYIDLFAGAGRYSDGEPSTPVRVLERLIANSKLAERVLTYFNEMRLPIRARGCVTQSRLFPGVHRLKNQPVVTNAVVNDDAATTLAAHRFIRSLSFADPYGYKGLTLRLINAILKDWEKRVHLFL